MVKKLVFAHLVFIALLVFCKEASCTEKSGIEGRVMVRFGDSVPGLRQALDFASRRGMEIERDMPIFSRLRGKRHVVIRSALPTELIISLLRLEPSVEKVQPVYTRMPFGNIPDDPLYHQQWGMEAVSAPFAWDIATGSSDIIVAVIDTGIDYSHPDISPNMWINVAELHGTEGTDDDGNGYIDDIFGYHFARGEPDPMDIDGHGTHVAGIIGAAGNNSLGIAGVNWTVGLMALNVLTGSIFKDDDLIEAISYAVMMKKDFGVNIVAINASWGGKDGEDGDMLYEAIEQAASAGIAFVASAGNFGEDSDKKPVYPASYNLPNILSVAASTSANNLWSSSNYGSSSVHLAAPGANVLSALPHSTAASVSAEGEVFTASGIEFGGVTDSGGITGLIYQCGQGYPGEFPPEVAGNIALIKRGGLYFNEKVENAMSAGASSVIIYNNIPDGQTGGGIINATLGSPGDWVPAVFISENSGEQIKLMGTNPSGAVYNIQLGASYGTKSGTSMAAPFVSGAIALLSSQYPDETVVRQAMRVLDGVVPMNTQQDRDRLITGGRLDLQGAFQVDYPKLGDINGDGEINIIDVVKCLRMAIEIDPPDLSVADINGDWRVDIADVIRVLRMAEGLE